MSSITPLAPGGTIISLDTWKPATAANPVAPNIVSPPQVDVILEDEEDGTGSRVAPQVLALDTLASRGDGERDLHTFGSMLALAAAASPPILSNTPSLFANPTGSTPLNASTAGAPAPANGATGPTLGSAYAGPPTAMAVTQSLERKEMAGTGSDKVNSYASTLQRLGSRLSASASNPASASDRGSAATRQRGYSRQGSVASSSLQSRRRSWLSRTSDEGRRMSGLTMVSLRRTFEGLPGLLQDHYVIDRKLGSGAFGEVALAVSKASGEKVAVKSIPLSEAALFEREYEIAKRLKHPCIVRLLDMFKDNPGESAKCHLCMELCSGGDLMCYVKSFEEATVAGIVYVPPRTESVAAYIWQCLQGIDYLHHHCIVHRDIKAENYLRVSPSSADIKLIDFGLSWHLLPGKRMVERVGTMGCCAPETLLPGPHGYTELCDLWSAGILFYLLLVGEYPIQIPKGTSLEDAHRITMETEINYNKGAWKAHEEAAKELVQAVLSKNPEDRPSAKALLMNAWLRKTGRHEAEEAEPAKCCGCLW
mmetsp:Transcript_53727/g.120693  ORF Transcript_53727/g.120693 Transcript_53727/m.120693 type:complete len:537 (-) Transcript_53727:24-1634(-)